MFTEFEPAVIEMSQYFPPSLHQVPKFSISDLRRIAELLSYPSSQWRDSWSRAPRLYCVLRLINLESEMTKLIDGGTNSDLWFPFNARTVPWCLSPQQKEKFLDAQKAVITDDLFLEKDVEGGKESKHVHFERDESSAFKRLAILGKGGFGEVDKVESRVSHRVYARKRTRRACVLPISRAGMEVFERERNCMMKIRHHHCVEFIGSYTTPIFLGLLISPVAELNLEELLSERQVSFPERYSLLRTLFGCLSSGIKYLHEEIKIRHRDIKPANILIYEGSVKIADFGLSLDWAGGNPTTTKGTCPGWSRRYCAPEVAQFQPRNSSSDIWSLGCIFLEITTVLKRQTVDGLLDFLGENGRGGFGPPYHSKKQAITAWTQRLVSISDEDNEPIAWVDKMLERVKERRPTASQLVKYTCSQDKASGLLYCGNCCADIHP
ncbi:kinase-like domain-containing protein [Annulohypoxylon bovei var. microspora]|nr:kinase-like domain-containing protein [Annulohypoxylon bovei var. microspora]